MKNVFKAGLLAGLLLPLCATVNAQDSVSKRTDTTSAQKKYHPLEINLQLRSLYIWRGFKVSDAPISDVDAHYQTRDGRFTVGVWGGESFTGDYKEFSYYANYSLAAFNFSLWDINNVSDFPKADIFNYNPSSTSHFLDATLSYQFKPPFPLLISWSTIIQGRDTYLEANGHLKNAYSNYVLLDYKLWGDALSDLHVFAGGGFAFGRQANFYGSKPNVVNTGLTLNKTLTVLEYHLPISATAMFSPEHKYGALQLIVNVF